MPNIITIINEDTESTHRDRLFVGIREQNSFMLTWDAHLVIAYGAMFGTITLNLYEQNVKDDNFDICLLWNIKIVSIIIYYSFKILKGFFKKKLC